MKIKVYYLDDKEDPRDIEGVDGIVEFLVSFSEQLDPKYDTDLLNIRDEMLGLINKSKFLLKLKY